MKVKSQTFQFDRIIALWEAIHKPTITETKWIGLFKERIKDQRWTISGSSMYPHLYETEKEVLQVLDYWDSKIAIPVHLPPQSDVKLNDNHDTKIINGKVLSYGMEFTFETVDKVHEAILRQQQ